MKKIGILLLILLSPLFWRGVGAEAFAQKPHLYPLHGNAALIQHSRALAKKNKIATNGRTPRPSNDSLLHGRYLPFFDDFSYAGPYPNDSLWLDQSVFVNHTKAIAPPTLGVATFDGLNQYGYPYDSTVTSANQNPAAPTSSDTLTSHPIRLDSLNPSYPTAIRSLSPADSVYLSFYYQGMGFWEYPLSDYELDLDFYSPIDSVWYNVWSVIGSATIYVPDSMFHLVMIPITDSAYFANGFKFRFRNLSCACGDDDHWHIDVVELNNGRNYLDTIFPDVSFVYDLQSPLKNYTQMPYNQYVGAGDMKEKIYAVLRSNYYNATPPTSYTVSISTYYNIFDALGTSVLPGGAQLNGNNNLVSYYNSGYCNDTALIKPSLGGFTYNTPLAFADTFLMKFYINKISEGIVQNDTVSFHQVFSNYFAYDDGSAEAAIGMESVNCPGNYKIAARYVLNKKDTLRSIDIFFDPIIDVGILATSPFNLMVWADGGGVPGTSIYTDTTGGNLRYPYFAPNHPVLGVQRENMFNRYELLHPVYLDSGQVFYVGINQVYNTPAIPIGFDMNTDYHNNFFTQTYDLYCNPTWYPLPGDEDPSYRGSLMMRPVFGDSLEALGIRKYNNTVSANISVYPNPATDQIFIQSDNTITKVVVTDLIGNLVIEQIANPIQIINTASLQDGVYLIKAFTDKGLTDTKKLIISR